MSLAITIENYLKENAAKDAYVLTDDSWKNVMMFM
jgi:hypothetical protein